MDKIYTFGPFELDQSKQEVLSKVTHKKLVGIRCGILDFLITNREQTVEKSALINAVWSPGARVDDGTVRNHVSHIRTWLGKNNGGETATYIPPGAYDGKYQFIFKPISERPCRPTQGTEFTFTASPWSRSPMEALFLLFDEELIINRPGRLRTFYTPEKIAYWLHFYSLFLDTLYVPANHLLDNKFTASIFEALNIHNADLPIRVGREGPLRILWDTSQFGPVTSFSELLSRLEATSSYVSERPHDSAVAVALLCDKYLSDVVEAAPMNFFIDVKQSVRRLDDEAFNKYENHALEGYTFDRLRECLSRITERGDLMASGNEIAFGRSFYYTLWGYCANSHQKKTERKFSDIISEYRDLRHVFLTAVDYVALALKATCATEALGRQIDVVMPKEYGYAVVRPQKTQLIDLGDIAAAANSANDPY